VTGSERLGGRSGAVSDITTESVHYTNINRRRAELWGFINTLKAT